MALICQACERSTCVLVTLDVRMMTNDPLAAKQVKVCRLCLPAWLSRVAQIRPASRGVSR